MKTKLQNGITLMNALLCLCVITIHLTSNPVVELLPFSVPHILIFAVNKILVFAVPGFLFLSGLKLYSQYGSRDFDVKQFYLRRFQKIAIPYGISMVAYFIYYYGKNWVSLHLFPVYLLLGTMVSHFYYIIIALQLYLLFPLLKKAVNRCPLATVSLSLVSTIIFYSFIHPPIRPLCFNLPLFLCFRYAVVEIPFGLCTRQIPVDSFCPGVFHGPGPFFRTLPGHVCPDPLSLGQPDHRNLFCRRHDICLPSLSKSGTEMECPPPPGPAPQPCLFFRLPLPYASDPAIGV